jgi:hypothetical protein
LVLSQAGKRSRRDRGFVKRDQRSSAFLPTIQRIEASEGVIRGNVDSPMKLMAALDALGIELITTCGEPRWRASRAAEEGDDVRLAVVLCCAAVQLALAPLAVVPAASRLIYGACMAASTALAHLLAAARVENVSLPLWLRSLGAHLCIDALPVISAAVHTAATPAANVLPC